MLGMTHLVLGKREEVAIRRQIAGLKHIGIANRHFFPPVTTNLPCHSERSEESLSLLSAAILKSNKSKESSSYTIL